MPNEADFSVNENEGKYTATIAVEGTITVEIKADSLEDAKAKAEAEADRISLDCDADIDQIDRIDVRSVRKYPPMFRVMRDRIAMQVVRLSEGDEPRSPNGHGF